MRIVVAWSGWKSPRRSWETLTSEALKEAGNEIYVSHKLEKLPFEPDVVFSTSNIVLARYYAKKYNRPYVHWVIAGFPEKSPEEFEEALLKADLLLAVSETARSDFLKSFPHDVENKLKVAYHGVPDGKDPVKEVSKDEAFCFIGSPDDVPKRFSWFAEAVSLAGVKARIISPDPFKIDENMKQLSAGGEIHTAVDNEKVFEFLAKSRALVVTSSWETFGLHIAEAASVNLPVISSDLQVVRELYGDAPLYFENVDECAWWILMLVEEPEIGLKVGANLRRIFEEKELDLKSCAKRLLRWFNQIANSRD